MDLQIDQVGASSQNQNLRTDVRWVAKWIRNSPKLQKRLAIDFCRLALGGQTVKNLRLLPYEFQLGQIQCKSSEIRANPRKCMVKRNASPKIASTCESVWTGLPKINEFSY